MKDEIIRKISPLDGLRQIEICHINFTKQSKKKTVRPMRAFGPPLRFNVVVNKNNNLASQNSNSPRTKYIGHQARGP